MSLNLQERKQLLVRLGNYLVSDDRLWVEAKAKAFRENPWFIPQFIDLAVKNIANNILEEEKVADFAGRYHIPGENNDPQKVGIVMAGNIPLVGFHDLFCVFLAGHIACVKLSSKDDVLTRHLVNKMIEWNAEVSGYIMISERLNGCEAYIATGSNNTSRYFEYYFRSYPSIIRKNRTSVAILTGEETSEELGKLADDVHQYFGLGCRNVTKLYVPNGYDFIPLLEAFKKYSFLSDHNKYINNYDYNLAINILNKRFYMSNGTVLLVEDNSIFSPICQLHYEFYSGERSLMEELKNDDNIQAIVGKDAIGFGEAQCPGNTDYADGVDTMKFLLPIHKTELRRH